MAWHPSNLTRLSSPRQLPVAIVPLDYRCAVAIDTRQRLSCSHAGPYFYAGVDHHHALSLFEPDTALQVAAPAFHTRMQALAAAQSADLLRIAAVLAAITAKLKAHRLDSEPVAVRRLVSLSRAISQPIPRNRCPVIARWRDASARRSERGQHRQIHWRT
jgi:hypothetical protein